MGGFANILKRARRFLLLTLFMSAFRMDRLLSAMSLAEAEIEGVSNYGRI